ncbi:MAG: phytanoyl-CoA dioxygenase family protein [Armatimonadetes bacterium]|nr:phytanoyl-CoA dioxygenase family protein [Armatimonadota bacterium]MDE2206005.1 phytanoyl-CoA dioxygenase family protein [Armatimonadota bacterium]
MRARYANDGYLVMDALVSAEMCAELRERVDELIHAEAVPNGIVMQVEPRVERGERRAASRAHAIRKIDGLAVNDPLFRALTAHGAILDVVKALLGPNLKLFRNSLLLKPPSVGSAKGWHQDSPYWPIQPMALCSLWLALDDATTENGCMVVLPGQHMRGPLAHQAVCDDYVIEDGLIDPAMGVAVPMPAGSGLFFHSLLPHYTAPNTSSHWRRAMVLSFMSADSRYTGDGPGPVYAHVAGETLEGCVR